ncbi:zinc-dependent metalloprotease [Granulicoccus phenolivorans]|uniref:zinc-dependent metalloprotease n=1 Tax=Granulicoccus phenolivorans TaxID=266854 RepID=UPI0004798099|nr:zinc-dependent metalloprotease [Granulicoccus phenolivorans]
MADDPGREDPFSEFFKQFGFGGSQPADLNAMLQQLQAALSQMGMGGMFATGPNQSGGMSWETIRDIARRTVSGEGSDPTTSAADLTELRDAVRLAEMWLDEVTELPGGSPKVEVWSRAEWVENTMGTWRRMIDPVMESMAEAMADSVTAEGLADEQAAGLEAMLRPLVKSSGANMFGLQAGQAIGKLAVQVLSATEAGLPLDGEHADTLALLPHNVAAFAEGLTQSKSDILLYLALREAARLRLFRTAAWLGPQMLNLIEQYARGIKIDTSWMEDAARQVEENGFSPETMAELQQQMEGRLFSPVPSPNQAAVLARLETLLALVEGWVDDVVAEATAKWMPNAVPLAETLRRRRATDGPAEAVFQALVGLELRPRRMRDAANLWAAIRTAVGNQQRDGLWKHPDLVPDEAALDDPVGFAAELSGSGESHDLDAELEKLLNSEGGPTEGNPTEEDPPQN